MTTDAYDFEQKGAWEQKCWGSVQHVFNSPDVAVSVLKINAEFRCSRHFHRSRDNRFLLVSGLVQIQEWTTEERARAYPENPDSKYWLFPGKSHVVPAGVPHLFKVIVGGMMVEVYTPAGGPVDINDIVRFDEGGPV